MKKFAEWLRYGHWAITFNDKPIIWAEWDWRKTSDKS